MTSKSPDQVPRAIEIIAQVRTTGRRVGSQKLLTEWVALRLETAYHDGAHAAFDRALAEVARSGTSSK